jgi:hypothetical protein
VLPPTPVAPPDALLLLLVAEDDVVVVAAPPDPSVTAVPLQALEAPASRPKHPIKWGRRFMG